LLTFNSEPLAILEDIQIYPFNKTIYSKLVFGTLDRKHPGVEEAYQSGDYLVGGDIRLIDNEVTLFPEHNHTPEKNQKNVQLPWLE